MAVKKLAQRLSSVSAVGVEWARSLSREFPDILRMETAELNVLPPAAVWDAAAEALRRKLSHYSDFEGLPELRQAVASHLLRRTGVEYDPHDEVVVTAGASEANFLALMALLDPGDEALLPDPSYPNLEKTIRLLGGIPVRIPYREGEGWRLDLAAFSQALSPRCKMVVVVSPNNPTGTVLNFRELQNILDACRAEGLFLLFDAAFDGLVYNGAMPLIAQELQMTLLELRDQVLWTGGLAKTYALPSLRIGWLAGPEHVMRAVRTVLHPCLSVMANLPGQYAAAAALAAWTEWLTPVVVELRRRRDYLVAELNTIEGITCRVPEGGFFVFPNHERLEPDSYRFSEYLIRSAGISVSPGADYGTRGEGHVRMVFGALDTGQLEEAVHRLRSAARVYALG
ncbi:MAG: pyridoxal phosphate-dependent aminotransferase [Bacillota bacterium]|nr:pyridoxal phosphate-dependent aminotransferase [Bacillota bacterium]